MRNAWAWTLGVVSIALALPAMLLMFVSEKIGDYADEWID
jgi:hypothetical protein